MRRSLTSVSKGVDSCSCFTLSSSQEADNGRLSKNRYLFMSKSILNNIDKQSIIGTMMSGLHPTEV